MPSQCPLNAIVFLSEKSTIVLMMNADHKDMTLVVTSCRRHDLLVRTIDSMSEWLDVFHEKIIVEDSPQTSDVLENFKKQGWLVLINDPHRGQHASIDRAYRHVTTKFIFHIEDDWHFERRPNFEASKKILNGFHIKNGRKKASLVQYSNNAHSRSREQNTYRTKKLDGTLFGYDERSRKSWGAFSFNPCLLPTSLWQEHGPWWDFVTERGIGIFLRRKKLFIVTELPPLATHIGVYDNVFDPTRKRRRNLQRRIRQLITKGIFK